MKTKRLITILLSVSLASTVMLGCNKKVEDKKEAATMDKSPVTLNFFTADLGEDMEFNDPVAKKITELTGVTLKITHPVGGDTNAVPLMIASGEYPDIIYGKGDTPKLIEAGAVIKLDDLIEKKGSNLKKLYGDYIKRLRNSTEDPSIYTVGAFGVNSATWNTGGYMQLQHAVLKELGYPKIKTLKDYENAIKQYIAKHPTIDGQKTIGMTLMASDWRWIITVGNLGGQTAGIPDDGQWKIDDKTQQATYKFVVPEVKEYFKWLNGMNAQGLLDPESFTQKQDAYIAKISSGRVLGLTDADWDYGDATKALLTAKKAERTYAPLAVTNNETIKAQTLKNYGYGGGGGIAICNSSKNKDRAFQFLDWMASDEAQVLNNWGIEGVNYTVENGKRVISKEELQKKASDKNYPKTTGVGRYVYPFPSRGDGVKDSTGNYYSTNSEQNIIDSFNDAQKETLKGYGVKLFTDLFPQRSEFEVSKHGQAWQLTIDSSSDLATIQKKADDYTQKAITQAILGKPENFDAAWDKIQKDLKDMGIDKANEQMTALVKAKIALWNK